MTLEELEGYHSDSENEVVDVEVDEEETECAGDLHMALTFLEQCQLLLDEIIYPKPRGRSITKQQAKEASTLAQEVGVFLEQFNYKEE